MKRSVFTGIALMIITCFIMITGCVKDNPDEPPQTTIPFDDDLVLTINELRAWHIDHGDGYVFTDNYSFYATVGMDESSGNIYKSVYVQDNEAGIQLNFFNPGGLYLGDSIRILLTGTTLETYGGILQVNNFDVGSNVLKIATQKYVKPKIVTISELTNNIDLYESMVIQLNEVQFTENMLGQTFADSANRIDEDRDLEDCIGKKVIVRTSGYANFANKLLPEGNGTLIAIASRYNTTIQLVVRTYDEVRLDAERCEIGSGIETIHMENFDDSWGDWYSVNKTGDQEWERNNSDGPDGSACAKINGFDAGYHLNEDWLISPSIDLTSYEAAFLFFESAKNYDGDDINVLISDNYTGNPSTASWTELSALISQGGFTWTESGSVNISEFVENNVWIAFKYTSTNSSASEWRIDNIEIKAE